eukprot:1383050-Pleurochrysis_carterae.AAC.1
MSAPSPRSSPRSTRSTLSANQRTRQFNENERRLKFMSMITYPAHLASYQSAGRTSTSVLQGWQHPFAFAD